MLYLNKIFLLVNTIKYLKVSQLFFQFKNKFKRQDFLFKYIAEDFSYDDYSLWINELDFNKDFINKFQPNKLLNNEICLLNETHLFNKWNYSEASHLWNFNLHYLEYLVSLVSKGLIENDDKYIFKVNTILDDWYSRGIVEADSNHPYTISLRIINMLLISSKVNDKDKLFKIIYAQYKFLIHNQEKHLLGNHYLENLKSIVICSVIFKEESVYTKYIRKLCVELDEQITDDGLHFELSIMYHKIILEDLLRVAIVLKQANKKEVNKIVFFIEKMAIALYSIEYGINRTPLFNDAGDNVSKSSSSLLLACKNLFGIKFKLKDSISGYYKLYNGNITVIEDCGMIASRYMTGHSHCDCLSFELYIDGNPFLVNCGTFQYQGILRNFFRSTKAHNTFTINNEEQSEIWGEHRTGRRIKNIKFTKKDNTLVCEFTNYLGTICKRILSLDKNILTVLDASNSEGIVRSYLHLAPNVDFMNEYIIYGEIKFKLEPINSEIKKLDDHIYSPEFGISQKIICLEFSWESDNNIHGYKIHLDK